MTFIEMMDQFDIARQRADCSRMNKEMASCSASNPDTAVDKVNVCFYD